MLFLSGLLAAVLGYDAAERLSRIHHLRSNVGEPRDGSQRNSFKDLG